MIRLIKNADIYPPEHLGKRDILICDEKISAIAEERNVSADDGLVEIIDI